MDPHVLLVLFSLPQNWSSQSHCIVVCNQFPLAHILSDLFECEGKHFLLFVQHNVDPAGE